jgi:uncharacterized protein (TIGR00255 family)
MAQSMTGFGSAENDFCRVEIRSVNHRYFDAYIRTPSFLSQHDIRFRNVLKDSFSRGKFDVTITVSEQAVTEFAVNTGLAAKFYDSFRKLQDELSIGGEIDINSLVNLHELFIEANPSYDMGVITETFRVAVEDLYRMRRTEGESLAAGLRQMLGSLSVMNEKVRSLSSGTLKDIKDKFSEKMKLLLEGGDISDDRILQEAAVMAARLDVSEEIARIESHLSQFGEILDESDTIGRKLDFVLQELNREVNTIASKSSRYEVSSLTVEMKTEIEKIREQVQNIQ